MERPLHEAINDLWKRGMRAKKMGQTIYPDRKPEGADETAKLKADLAQARHVISQLLLWVKFLPPELDQRIRAMKLP